MQEKFKITLKYSFIEFNENNEIIASADFKFNENAVQNNREVVRGYDGKLYFKDNEPKQPLDELKQAKILAAKQRIEKNIYETYPMYKQSNIAIYGTDEEKATFLAFKKPRTDAYNTFVNEVIKCKNENELDLLDFFIDF